MQDSLPQSQVNMTTFGNLTVNDTNREAYGRILAFDPAKDNLYLFGGCGVGKTTLANLLFEKWSERLDEPWGYRDRLSGEFIKVGVNKRSKMVSWPKLCREIRAHVKDAALESSTIETYSRETLLVIDDLGVGHDTEYSSKILWEILDGRRGGGLIITSNFNLGQLAERMGSDRVASRIAGLCDVVEVPGNDFRLMKK